eukprot:2428740-Amphidinium_carterae.1
MDHLGLLVTAKHIKTLIPYALMILHCMNDDTLLHKRLRHTLRCQGAPAFVAKCDVTLPPVLILLTIVYAHSRAATGRANYNVRTVKLVTL